MGLRPGSKSDAEVWVVAAGSPELQRDEVATEEPLEIRLTAGLQERGGGAVPVFSRRGQAASQRTVAITMRTPGADFELAAGFLYGEGIVRSREEILRISHSEDADLDEDKRYNIVQVDLRAGVLPDLAALERHF